MISIIFKAITHGSSEYIPAIQLSEGILRTPLGLTFSREELEKEKMFEFWLHFLSFPTRYIGEMIFFFRVL